MRLLSKTNRRIELFLVHRGFYLEDVRVLMRNQAYFLFLGCALMVCTGLSHWATSFAAGTALITMNFWFLAKGLQQIMHRQEGAVALSLIRFYGRMALTGLLLFGLIVWGGLSVPALAAGLTTVLLNILLWGVFRFYRQKVKEA